MAIGHEFSIASESFEGLVLPDRTVTLDIVEDFRLQNEESAVNPPFPQLGFLSKAQHLPRLIVRHVDVAVPSGGAYNRHRSNLAVGAVEREQVINVDVCNAVAPREHERLIADVRLQAFDASARLRRDARVDEFNPPVWALAPVGFQMARGDVHGHVGAVRAVVDHVFLDNLALVSERNDEVFEPKVPIDLHDVPENGLIANLDHRFRLDRRFFGEARATTASEDSYLHRTDTVLFTCLW